jgi:hypothetical protein
MNFIKTAYNKQPIATALVTIGVAYFGFRAIRNAINKPKVPDRPVIPPVPQKGQAKYTFGATEYLDKADVLASAFYPWGTDDKVVLTIMSQMKTYDDVLALIDAYGKRPVRTIYGWDSDPFTLAQTIYDEMSPQLIEKAVNTPIKRTGYKF